MTARAETHPLTPSLEGRGSCILLDGATGTELDRRGVDISLPLWSARAIVDAPETLEAVHRDYLEAGAEWITAATFRTHRRSLAKAGLGDRARELTIRAVEIAQRERDAGNPEAKVLGSVAPLEDCYRPDLAPDREVCAREHRELIAHLVEAGIDLLLIETMNCVREALAAAESARELAAGRWAISFCTRADDPLKLLSGESLVETALQCPDAAAVGVNCVAAPSVEPAVRRLREAMPPEVSIIAYANIGSADADGNWICTDAVEPRAYAAHARTWRDAGATIIGGCCGTTPATIRALRGAVD